MRVADDADGHAGIVADSDCRRIALIAVPLAPPQDSGRPDDFALAGPPLGGDQRKECAECQREKFDPEESSPLSYTALPCVDTSTSPELPISPNASLPRPATTGSLYNIAPMRQHPEEPKCSGPRMYRKPSHVEISELYHQQRTPIPPRGNLRCDFLDRRNRCLDFRDMDSLRQARRPMDTVPCH